MSRPSPEELAEAERTVNALSQLFLTSNAFKLVLGELDRLRAVEAAAVALVDHWQNTSTGGFSVYTKRNIELLDALSAAVRGGETE